MRTYLVVQLVAPRPNARQPKRHLFQHRLLVFCTNRTKTVSFIRKMERVLGQPIGTSRRNKAANGPERHN